jgi:exodeoxyribonuclease VII large subunit
MELTITQRLREWRATKAREEHTEIFKILHNQTIELIGELYPRNEEEFVAIKGLGGKKFSKYGHEILAIVREYTGEYLEQPKDLFTLTPPNDQTVSDDSTLSVSQYLDLVNSLLNPVRVSVRGEISEFKVNKHAYFSIRDPKDGSVLSCFMWDKDYEICGITGKEGLEVIVCGFGNVHKPNGRMSFSCSSMELVGEGALQKAYEELKKKLTLEGAFAPDRKKPLPVFPVKLGVITSKHGAVINDLNSNLGRFGYQIRLYDTRVEGALAIRELLEAIQYFKNQPIDLLVVIRGGGSLESLQAFNNEALIRAILDYAVPVICGIGHDKDVPLFSMTADLAVSTPTACAREINRSWELSTQKIPYYEQNFLVKYTLVLDKAKQTIEKSLLSTSTFRQQVREEVTKIQQKMESAVGKLLLMWERFGTKQTDVANRILQKMESTLETCNLKLDHIEKFILRASPEKQLKLGYSILQIGEKVIRSIHEVKLNEKIKIKVSDGEISSVVEEIIHRE